MIRGVPADKLPQLWKHGEAFIKRSLDRADGMYDHHCIRQFCENRQMQLWLVGHKGRVIAAIVTEVVCYPLKKVLRGVTMAGKDIDKWIHQADKMLEAFALSLGCEGMECCVRPGLSKKMSALGYNKRYEGCYRQIF